MLVKVRRKDENAATARGCLNNQDSGNRVLNFCHDDRQSCVEGTLDFQVGCGLNVGTAWHLK